MTEFSKLITDKYLLQIKQDSESFGRGLKLIENTNNAIRNRVEVERLKSDRNFQDIVAVVGSVTAIAPLLKEGKNECKWLLGIRQSKDQPSLCDYTLFYGCVVVGLKQKSSPNIAQTGFIRSKQVTIQGQPIKKSERYSCSKSL